MRYLIIIALGILVGVGILRFTGTTLNRTEPEVRQYLVRDLPYMGFTDKDLSEMGLTMEER